MSNIPFTPSISSASDNAATPAVNLASAAPYEAPAIESILSPNDLQREVLYAGVVFSDPDVGDIP